MEKIIRIDDHSGLVLEGGGMRGVFTCGVLDSFMVKNSWGEYGKYKGMFYASKAYVAYKTMNILIHKNAIPTAIAKKLGL